MSSTPEGDGRPDFLAPGQPQAWTPAPEAPQHHSSPQQPQPAASAPPPAPWQPQPAASAPPPAPWQQQAWQEPPRHRPVVQVDGRTTALHPGGIYQRPVWRKRNSIVLPIIAIIIGSLVVGGHLLVSASAGSVGTVALVTTSIVAAVGVLYLTWLDRWEPEPPVLLASAFLWGGGVAIVIALIINTTALLVTGSFEFTATVVAPLVEEPAKAAFLFLLIMTQRGRAEFNTRTDAIVYGGMIGLGFSFVEDLSYIMSGATTQDAIFIAAIRTILGGFGHSIMCIVTALGCWYGVQRGGGWQVGGPALGLLGAILLHVAHNGSTTFGFVGLIAETLLVSLPATVFLIWLAAKSRARDGVIVAKQLPVMVASGWVSPQQAYWLQSPQGRKDRLAREQNREARGVLRTIADASTELAFVRERLDHSTPPLAPELLAHHDELVGILVNNRAAWGPAID